MAAMTIKELEDTLLAAKKQLAKVDREYVGYDYKGHLFDYKVDFEQFIADVSHVIKEAKRKGM